MDVEDAGCIGNPQRLPMSHELFTEGNTARELLAKQTLQSSPGVEQESASGLRATSQSRVGARCPPYPGSSKAHIV